MKKIILSVSLAAGILIVSTSVFAQGHENCQGMQMGDQPVAGSGPVKAVDVGNKVCPVLGEEIDPNNKVTVEYKGKSYNLCCSSCVEEFNKDPEKYIKKVQAQEK